MTIMQALIKKIEQAEKQTKQKQQPTQSGAIQLLRDIFKTEKERKQ